MTLEPNKCRLEKDGEGQDFWPQCPFVSSRGGHREVIPGVFDTVGLIALYPDRLVLLFLRKEVRSK